MRRWLLGIGLGLVGLVVVVAGVGALLPVGHQASRTVTILAPRERVFEVVSDFGRYGEWRSDVTRVAVVSDDSRGTVVVEDGANGEIAYRVEVLESPRRIVTRIVGDDLPFGGTWTWELQPAGAGTELTLTEDGEVYNPIFRFLSRFVFSPHATIDTYLADLKRHVE